jgi:hypothetical protein
MAGRRSHPEKPATTARGPGTIIAFHSGKPLRMKEVCPVSYERVHRDEETPKGKPGFAMKSSKGAWVGLLVLGVLVCPYALGYAAEDTQAESSFLAFQKTWIQKLNKEGRYGEKSMRVDRSAEDRSLFVARYDVVKEAGECRIKKTGQTTCPYVGVMRYEVWTCSAKGKTQDEAKRGPFDCQPQSEITEIFRYAGGMWVY